MTDCNYDPGRSTLPAQADNDKQVPACVAKIGTIEALGQAPDEVVPCCTRAGQSFGCPHAAVRGARAAMVTRTRCVQWSLALATGGLVALGWVALDTSPLQIVYNASDSVPAGWYRITSTGSVAVGDIVLIRLPVHAATLAAKRGYLPKHVPLLKTVAAVPPQNVCVRSDQVLVDGQIVAKRLHRDRQGRALPIWQTCRHLAGDELFLLSTANPESFDSRYFGPVSASAVIGRAQPLWLESRR